MNTIEYKITDMVKIEYTISDGINTYSDTLIIEKLLFDSMTDAEKTSYIETKFEEWKLYIANPV